MVSIVPGGTDVVTTTKSPEPRPTYCRTTAAAADIAAGGFELKRKYVYIYIFIYTHLLHGGISKKEEKRKRSLGGRRMVFIGWLIIIFRGWSRINDVSNTTTIRPYKKKRGSRHKSRSLFVSRSE